MNAALDRDPATPVSFQAELRRDGGVVGRYNLPHPATNFAIAAFGETALAVRGGVTNAATVRRVDGMAVPETSLAELLRDATRFELVWRTAEGDPDADPDGDGLTTRDEIGRHGTDPKQADTDGDGLSDASELLLGSNPLDADENGDGVPDGVDPATWAAHSLWPTNETGNIIVSLVEAIPTNMAATFQIGDLSIPLRDPDTWTFSLEPVPDSGVVHYGAATLAPGALRFGEVTLSADAHGCFATRIEPFCSVCGEYEPEDAELWIESDTLTLKHDDQLLFGIFHEYSPNVLYESPSIEIRRQRDSEWLPLGSLADLTPWTARVAGMFFVRGRAVVSGRPVWTQEEALEVRFPDYDDIADDGNVLLAMESAWRRTKDEASPSGRCEFGFWIRLDTRNGRYITEPLEYGLDTSSSSGGVLLPSPRPADVPLDPDANATGAVYTVGHFHTHTPRTYLLPTNQFRLVGPSDADVRFCSGKHLPGIVCDYVGDSYTGETTNRLYNGHNLEAPDMLYPVPPERRPIP